MRTLIRPPISTQTAKNESQQNQYSWQNTQCYPNPDQAQFSGAIGSKSDPFLVQHPVFDSSFSIHSIVPDANMNDFLQQDTNAGIKNAKKIFNKIKIFFS